MFRKAAMMVCTGVLAVNLCGCVALLAGGAAAGGTAVWLSGKLTQEVNASFDQTIAAAKTAVQTLKLNLDSEVRKDEVAQLKGQYTDGRLFWIDIRRITNQSTRVDVRVGANGDKVAASNILRKIESSL